MLTGVQRYIAVIYHRICIDDRGIAVNNLLLLFDLQIQPISHHCSVKWRKGMELPHGVYRAQMLQLAGKIYLGGGDAPDKYNVIQEYNPAACVWSELTKSPVERAALAELGGKLLLAGNHVEGQAIGGRYSQVESNTRLTVWEAECSDWIHPYPHMENGRSYAAAVGYQNKLAVACGLAGLEEVGTVEVLDCAARTWHSADSVPLQGHHMSSAVIEDHWYISAHYWRDNKPHVFCTRLLSLASNASNVWCELGAPPVRSSTLLAYNSHLLLLGGLKQSSILQKDTFQDDIYCYEPSANTWRKCGKLPSKMSGCSCAVLPSGELLVVGGYNVKGKYSYSTQTWIGRLT